MNIPYSHPKVLCTMLSPLFMAAYMQTVIRSTI